VSSSSGLVGTSEKFSSDRACRAECKAAISEAVCNTVRAKLDLGKARRALFGWWLRCGIGSVELKEVHQAQLRGSMICGAFLAIHCQRLCLILAIGSLLLVRNCGHRRAWHILGLLQHSTTLRTWGTCPGFRPRAAKLTCKHTSG
jgi:hypothetical protein